MAFALAVSVVAACIAVASVGGSAWRALEAQPPEAGPSCRVPGGAEPGRRSDMAVGYVLLQTRTTASAALVPVDSGMRQENRTTVDKEVPKSLAFQLRDDASLLSIRVGQRSVAAGADPQQKTLVPLGMPGSAASLLMVLRHGAQQPSFVAQQPDASNFWAKLVILLMLCGILTVFCTGVAVRQRGARPSRHEKLAAAGLTLRSVVMAKQTLISDAQQSSEISQDEQGKIIKIDEEGDILIKFDTIKVAQWVFHRKALEVLRPLGKNSSSPKRSLAGVSLSFLIPEDTSAAVAASPGVH